MSQATVWTCDRCGATQREGDQATRWENAIKTMRFQCPPDGINLGRVVADLCGRCRAHVLVAIEAAVKPLAQ